MQPTRIAYVVKGNNPVLNGNTVVVPGFTAGKGFDVATGWGSLNAALFVPSRRLWNAGPAPAHTQPETCGSTSGRK